MKYEALRKTNRNKAVIQYHAEHPELSLEEVGEVYRITKQRVHQIIKRGC